jgi:hypothetical protein
MITISEYGSVRGDEDIMAEIAARGPVSAYINAYCLEDPVYKVICAVIVVSGCVLYYDRLLCSLVEWHHHVRLLQHPHHEPCYPAQRLGH